MVTVKINDGKPATTFADVPPGDVFIFNDRAYRKVSLDSYNAQVLESGISLVFSANDLATLCDAEIIVTPRQQGSAG